MLLLAVGTWMLAANGGELPAWAQWGVLGVVILGFVTRQLVPGWLYSDAKVELKELRSENKALVQQVLDTQLKTLPALEEATRAINAASLEIQANRTLPRRDG